ncbi:hypothetical protein [Pseudomonas zeae]
MKGSTRFWWMVAAPVLAILAATVVVPLTGEFGLGITIALLAVLIITL